MPTYKVRAVDERGAAAVLEEEAENERELAHRLSSRGLSLTRVVRVRSSQRDTKGRRLPRAVLADFTDRIQILYAAGVPLVECLQEIEQGARDPRMVLVAAQLRRRLQSGGRLCDALDEHPRTFPASYRAAVRAGEESGALDEVLRRLAEQIEWERWIHRTITQAFIYPAVLFCAVIGLVAFLFTFLLPRLMSVFVQAGVDLPAPTRAVVAVSNFLRAHGALLLACAVATVAAVALLRRTGGGRRFLDRVLVRLPGFGPLASKVASARFSATLRTLHQAGTPILSALEMSRKAAGNAFVEAELDAVLDRVRDGASLTEAMETCRALEPLVPRMISVGERSGSLTEALEHVQKLYDREVQASTKRLLSLLEPAVLLFAGALVAFVVFATLLPIFRLFGAIKR